MVIAKKLLLMEESWNYLIQEPIIQKVIEYGFGGEKADKLWKI